MKISSTTTTLKNSNCRSLVLLACSFVSVSSLAFAEEHGAGHEAAGFAALIPFWLNFLAYLLIMYFVLRKKVGAMLKDRSLLIEEQVNKGARELERAKKTLEEAEARFARATQESAALQRDIRQSAEAEAKQIVQDAEERAVRIRSQSRELAEAERKATESAIKRELSEIVVKKVSERIARELSDENDRARRAAALQGVSALVGK